MDNAGIFEPERLFYPMLKYANYSQPYLQKINFVQMAY